MKAAEALIDIMEDWNIDHIYGYPGDSVNNLVEALRKEECKIEFMLVRHEEVGALAAAAEGKLDNNIGVCLSIGGPGAIHLLNGMYDAKADRAPMVVITGQISHNLLGTDNFQEVNLEKLFDHVSVFNRTVTSGEQMRPLAEQAFKEAYTKKGVAVLTVPDDIFLESVEKPKTSSSTYTKPILELNEKDAIQAKEMINQAKKPVILAGKGAMNASNALEEFAEKIAAPIIISLRGKGVLPDKHPYMLGNLGQIGTKPAYEAMEDTDLLIMIGTSYPYRDFLPDKTHAIQIDSDATEIGKRYPVDIGIVSDAREALTWFNQHVTENENKKFLNSCQENMKNWWNHLKTISEIKDDEWLQGPQVIHQLQNYVDADAIVSVDVGNVSTWTTRFFQARQQSFVISSWLATMGCGLPGAIAAKKLHPHKQVIAICGDGGFSMVMQDFLTAVKYKLPMTILVFNNERIGMIKFEQEEMGSIPYQTKLQDMDYAKFAEACGGIGYQVNTAKELTAALESIPDTKEPTIIDVAIEEKAPLPGKIEWSQAMGYSKYLFKKIVERDNSEWDMPPLKTIIKRMF